MPEHATTVDLSLGGILQHTWPTDGPTANVSGALEPPQTWSTQAFNGTTPGPTYEFETN